MKSQFICLLICLLIGLLGTGPVLAERKPEIPVVRQKIGPVYAPPVAWGNSICFLSSSGALYLSNLEQTKVTELFKTKLQTVAEVTIDSDIAYFGDGLHENKESTLYAYDLKNKRIVFKTAVKGHIEKKAVIFGQNIFVGLGPGGVAAFNKKTGKFIWKTESHNGHPLHIDSAPIVNKGHIVVGSIYDYKAIVSLNSESGKIEWASEVEKSPKSDLLLFKENIVSLATDGDLATEQREVPSLLISLDIKSGKINFSKQLRGANYFPQLISKNELLTTLTTGDIIKVNLETGKTSVVDQYPEPFLSSPFNLGEKSCAASVMGRVFCYSEGKMTQKQEIGELVVGKTSALIGGQIYLPTRTGYAIFK